VTDSYGEYIQRKIDQWRQGWEAIMKEVLAMGPTLDAMADEVVEWAHAKGWFDREVPFAEAIALIHTEVSEAYEAYREHGLQDFTAIPIDMTIPKPEGVGNEFADILIRLLHYSRLFGIDLQAEYARKMAYNRTRPYRHGGKLS
jgi:NTP pyrophosphatase (non-canonical NTP hydrolase)